MSVYPVENMPISTAVIVSLLGLRSACDEQWHKHPKRRLHQTNLGILFIK